MVPWNVYTVQSYNTRCVFFFHSGSNPAGVRLDGPHSLCAPRLGTRLGNLNRDECHGQISGRERHAARLTNFTQISFESTHASRTGNRQIDRLTATCGSAQKAPLYCFVSKGSFASGYNVKTSSSPVPHCIQLLGTFSSVKFLGSMGWFIQFSFPRKSAWAYQNIYNI